MSPDPQDYYQREQAVGEALAYIRNNGISVPTPTLPSYNIQWTEPEPEDITIAITRGYEHKPYEYSITEPTPEPFVISIEQPDKPQETTAAQTHEVFDFWDDVPQDTISRDVQRLGKQAMVLFFPLWAFGLVWGDFLKENPVLGTAATGIILAIVGRLTGVL